MEAKKITVAKSDEATTIAEKIIDAPAKEIILSVPRFSKLAESGANFRLLKREAEALKKEIVVESVDDAVLDLARGNGLTARNPFFADSSRHFSDIVKGKPRREDEANVEKRHVQKEDSGVSASHHRIHEAAPYGDGGRRRWGRRFVSRAAIFGIVVVMLAAVISIVGFIVLPRADITVVAAKTEWLHSDSVGVDTEATAVDVVRRVIPGQIFKDTKNIQLLFPASGQGKIERKAKGTITIFNAHGTAPQPLVQNTRFQAPDGKIFRLVAKVTVPGARLEGGNIVPSSIKAEVIADVPGEAYNIAPVAKFTIPGFTGTPKAATFYASSAEPMQGGFKGDTAYPTKEDIVKAKDAAQTALRDSINILVRSQLDPDFKLLEGATQFKLITQKVNETIDADGKFSVFTEAELALTVFREKDVRDLIGGILVEEAGNDFEVRSDELQYGTPTFTTRGALTLPISYRGVLAKRISSEELRARVAGKSEADLRATIFSLSGLESAKISLWPFWVRKVPQNPEKIRVVVD